ncbi:class I SAM-dependent methyltransferase [Iodobacter violaceini]|uniref:class I SAM-dependent methyltransferase n=1 Tax=Iodobacter violaceini TaxID=3044271 RepID=UPI00197BEA25|nr:class I SAM-dependent methyltransferase [Iodobacter violacea]
MIDLDKNRFDAALIPGTRSALASAVGLLRQAEKETFAALLDSAGDFLPGLTYQRDCPQCGALHQNAELVMTAHGMHLLSCGDCGFIYSREVITPEQERLRYQNSSSAQCHLLQKQTDTYSFLEREKARYVAGRMHQFIGQGKGLEIGSSNGVLLEAAQELGWQMMGVEINADAVALSQTKGFTVVQGEYPAALPADEMPFNAIVVLDVLEHIADPLPFLSIVSSQLADPGYLIVQVPNFNSLLLRIEGAKNSNVCHGHWSYFTPDTLSALLLKAGFEVCFLETYITELDRIQAYPEDAVAAVYQQLSGKPLQSMQALNTDMLHDDYLGYKLFGIFRKIKK